MNLHLLKCEINHLQEFITCMLRLNHELKIQQGFDKLMEVHTCLFANYENAMSTLSIFEKNENANLDAHFQELLEGITRSRRLFFDCHLAFTKAIDAVAIPHIHMGNPTHHSLLRALKVCNSYDTCLKHSPIEHDKMKVHNFRMTYDVLRALNIFTPISEKLFNIQQSLDPHIPKLPLVAKEFDSHIETVKKIYSQHLMFLQNYMIGTFNYLFMPDSFNEIITTYGPKPVQHSYLFQQSPGPCAPSSTPDVQMIIQFFKKNIEFFIAPFESDQSFQTWAIENEEELTPFSDGLLKILSTKDHRTEFNLALMQLKAGNENRFIRFLKHPSIDTTDGFSLVEYMKKHLNNPIIEKWYADNYRTTVNLKL